MVLTPFFFLMLPQSCCCILKGIYFKSPWNYIFHVQVILKHLQPYVASCLLISYIIPITIDNYCNKIRATIMVFGGTCFLKYIMVKYCPFHLAIATMYIA